MTERHRLAAPCSGFLLIALLSLSGVFVERFVACTIGPPPPKVTISWSCSGRRPRPSCHCSSRPRSQHLGLDRPPRCRYH